MKILYLLFPFFLLLVQGAAGTSLVPGNEWQCKREGGLCRVLTCYHPYYFYGRCTNLEMVVNPWTSQAERTPCFWLLEPSPDVIFPPRLCYPKVV
uniref:Secreted protein n=1 Tax=Amazona collaria TaxID=241587 RepID=A0A8B9IZT5_9PSIT